MELDDLARSISEIDGVESNEPECTDELKVASQDILLEDMRSLVADSRRSDDGLLKELFKREIIDHWRFFEVQMFISSIYRSIFANVLELSLNTVISFVAPIFIL